MNSITKLLNKTLLSLDFSIKNLRVSYFYVLVLGWLIVYGVVDLRKIRENMDYYVWASQANLEQLHQQEFADYYHFDRSFFDYYQILQFCDATIPLDEKIKLIIPSEPLRQYWFLREKGRYFLYPRNWGDNTIDTNYILVYDVENFSTPIGFRIHSSFGPQKYLLERIEKDKSK